VLVCGGIIILVFYLAQLVHPSYQFNDVNSGGYEVIRMVGGNLFESVFVAGLIVSSFASALSAQASAGRILYVMGRDTVLPKKLFAFFCLLITLNTNENLKLYSNVHFLYFMFYP
jgi:putrescine importer